MQGGLVAQCVAMGPHIRQAGLAGASLHVSDL